MKPELFVVFILVIVAGIASILVFQNAGIDAQIVKSTKTTVKQSAKVLKQPVVVKKTVPLPAVGKIIKPAPAPLTEPFTIPSTTPIYTTPTLTIPSPTYTTPSYTTEYTTEPPLPPPRDGCPEKYKVQGTMKCTGNCIIFTMDDAGKAKLTTRPLGEVSFPINGDCMYCGIEYCNAQVGRMIQFGQACKAELSKFCWNKYPMGKGEDAWTPREIEITGVKFPDAKCIKCG